MPENSLQNQKSNILLFWLFFFSQFLDHLPINKKEKDFFIIVSANEDPSLLRNYLESGFKCMQAEFLMSGIIKQHLGKIKLFLFGKKMQIFEIFKTNFFPFFIYLLADWEQYEIKPSFHTSLSQAVNSSKSRKLR